MKVLDAALAMTMTKNRHSRSRWSRLQHYEVLQWDIFTWRWSSEILHSPPSRNKHVAVRVWVLHSEAVARAVRRSWTPTDGLLGLDVPHHYAADTKTNSREDYLFSWEASSTKVFWAAPSSGWEFTPAVVLASERNQVSIIRGEVQCLHFGLVKLQLGVDCSPSIVPDNHNGLGTHTFINYLSDNFFLSLQNRIKDKRHDTK